MRARLTDLRYAVLGAWVAVVAATQAWPSWETGIRDRFASDVVTYEAIARAAPGLPSVRFPEQRAERFPVHWALGSGSDVTGIGLHTVYRVVTGVCLLATLLVLHRAFVSLGLSLGAYAVCLGMVAASTYPVRYLLAAPGMLSDGVFVLGLAVVLLGFVERRDLLVVAGVAIAELGRQSAVPVAIVAAGALVLGREKRAPRAAGLTLAAVGAIYAFEWAVARGFDLPLDGGISGYTILGSLRHPLRFLAEGTFARADSRALPGLLVPLAVIAGCRLRGFRPQLLPLCLAVAVIVQPLLLAPHVVGNNATRLAALSLPALAVAAAYQLRQTSLSTGAAWVIAAAIFAGSLYPRYSHLGVPSPAVWAGIELLAAICIVLVLTLGSRTPIGGLPEDRSLAI